MVLPTNVVTGTPDHAGLHNNVNTQVNTNETDIAAKIAASLFDANTILKADTDNTPIALSVGASQIVGRLASGGIVAMTTAELKTLLALAISDVASLQATLDAKIATSLYDANTVLAATTDDTPAAITMGASTILARLASGNIVAASMAQIKTLLALKAVDVSGIDGAAPLLELVNADTAVTGTKTLVATNVATVHRYTLTGNVTLTFPGANVGASFTLILIQDATGSRLVTWPGTVRWPGGVAPVLSTGATKVDALSFTSIDGAGNWYGTLNGIDIR